MTETELNHLIGEYERLFHKVLKRCRVYVCSHDYEDYLQIAREAFFLYAKDFPTRQDFNTNYQLNCLFQRLCWRVYDAQRKHRSHQAILEQAKQWYVDTGTMNIDELPLYFKELWNSLTKQEQQLLEALFIQGWTMTNTASYLMVSRDTLYRWRNNVKKKLEEFELRNK